MVASSAADPGERSRPQGAASRSIVLMPAWARLKYTGGAQVLIRSDGEAGATTWEAGHAPRHAHPDQAAGGAVQSSATRGSCAEPP